MIFKYNFYPIKENVFLSFDKRINISHICLKDNFNFIVKV